ncbi:MAG: hypothetical protein PHI27_01880 [Eubacteriales bacterium]|nr:hypothetical protein [Eubacteriales bacterium]MDD3880981.1 hypothetical protein [Eubacteriales bacterium]MDD4511950.1 hypothetical protein [Eubacteriales bacterium]
METDNIPPTCLSPAGQSGWVNAHQINKNVMRDFSPSLYDGSAFSDEDYEWQADEEIPVILGWAWRERMKVGDSFQAGFMTLKQTFRVVGIFAENTYFPLFDSLIYEDDYIVMPTMRCTGTPQNDDEDFLQKITALQNASGYFRLSEAQSLSELAALLDTTAQQLGMFEVKLMRIDNARLLILAVSSDKHKRIYFGLMLAFLTCSLISMTALSRASVHAFRRREAARRHCPRAHRRQVGASCGRADGRT